MGSGRDTLQYRGNGNISFLSWWGGAHTCLRIIVDVLYSSHPFKILLLYIQNLVIIFFPKRVEVNMFILM